MSFLSTCIADIEREERRKESWQHNKVQQVKLECIIYIKVGQKLNVFLATVTFGYIWLVGCFSL